MENSEIMKRLMQDSNPSDSQQKSNSNAKGSEKTNELALSRIRVVTAKYKVLSILLLIFICILGFDLIPNAQSWYDDSVESYNKEDAKLVEINKKVLEASDDIKLLTWIIYNEENLAQCLNKKDSTVCSNLPVNWMVWEDDNREYDLTIPVSYLQLHSLFNKKMAVDEKKVLKNLNEYLIKEDMEWNWKDRVWNILIISIWDPSPVEPWDEHFFVVPVNVTIEFTKIEDLIWFLYNVEKKIIDKDKWWDRILYKIQTVSYDIISHDEPQVTDISMLAYYYYDEKFDWMDEYDYYFGEESESDNSEIIENKTNNEEVAEENWSFLDKIFSF